MNNGTNIIRPNPRKVTCWLFFWLFIFAFWPVGLVIAGDNLPAGARSMALSNATVSFSDVWSSFHNQAGIAGLNDITAGFYFESKYGIDELSLAAGSVVVPSGAGSFAVSLFQFGSGSFRVNKYGIAYARCLAKRWYAGLQLDYFSRLMPENDRATGFPTFEVGVLFRATANLHLGAHVFNPVNAGYACPAGKIQMPATIRAGGHYTFDDAVVFAVEAQTSNLQLEALKSGVEFYPVDDLTLRFGISAAPVRYTAGFGYRYRKVNADVGFGYHGSLGVTPAIALQLRL